MNIRAQKVRWEGGELSKWEPLFLARWKYGSECKVVFMQGESEKKQKRGKGEEWNSSTSEPGDVPTRAKRNKRESTSHPLRSGPMMGNAWAFCSGESHAFFRLRGRLHWKPRGPEQVCYRGGTTRTMSHGGKR